MNRIEYITIQEWMIHDLKLEKSTLLTYATIFSFSQGVNLCTLSNAEIGEFFNIDERTVRRAKKQLIEMKLIEEKDGGIVAAKPKFLLDCTESSDSGTDEAPAKEEADKMSEETEGGQNVQADKMSEKADKMSEEADKMSGAYNKKINNKI